MLPLRGGVARWCVASPAETARGCLTHPSRALAWLASHPPHPGYSLLGFRDLPPSPYQGGLRKKRCFRCGVSLGLIRLSMAIANKCFGQILGVPFGDCDLPEAPRSGSVTPRRPRGGPQKLPDAVSYVFLWFSVVFLGFPMFSKGFLGGPGEDPQAGL